MIRAIRLATPDDADELARLRWAFREEAGTPMARGLDEFRDEFRAFATDVLVSGSAWRAWVATSGDPIVGCVWIQIVERVPHPNLNRGERPIAYVTNLYVEPGLRGEGLGGRLLDAAVTFARDRRCAGVILWPSERSIPLHERSGFSSADAPLHLRLEGD